VSCLKIVIVTIVNDECSVILLLCDSATACPMVKVKDEWGEASDCDKGDKCTYCHSRMELQFHPDVSPFISCLAVHTNCYIVCDHSHSISAEY